MYTKAEIRQREKALAARIRAIRLEKNLKQEFMAFSMGISTATYCKLEGGSLCIKARHLWSFTDIFKTSVDKLMDA